MATYSNLVSGDSHIYEPFDLWQKALGPRFGDRLPHLIDGHGGASGRFFDTGGQVLAVAEVDSEHRSAGFHLAGYDPATRLDFQERAELKAEILYATYMQKILHSRHVEALPAIAEVYNDWIREFASHDARRLIGIGVIPMVDAGWAARELERCAAMGLRGVMINCREPVGCPPYRDAAYDPFWARASELGLPVTLHSLTGRLPDPFHFHDADAQQDSPRAMVELFTEIQGTLANEFIFGGLLDRYPSLKIIVSEFELSWLPHFAWRMDQMQGAFAARMPLPKLGLARASDYVRSRLWFGWIDDPRGAETAREIGAERVLWGSDFPHVRSAGVDAQSTVAALLGGLSRPEQELIAGGTAGELYSLAN